MKFLITGLGNIGAEYEKTRHNIGFKIADALCKKHKVEFKNERYAEACHFKLKGKEITVIKPTTFMNLSGNAVRYWMQKEKISTNNLLVLVDELALPFGTLRMKGSGSDGGHNGLKHIQEILASQQYARLRFGIGNTFLKGKQVDYVLGEWTDEETKSIEPLINRCVEAIETYCLAGIEHAMNNLNRK